MFLQRCFLIFFIGNCLCAVTLQAIWVPQQLEEVPIDRLIKNLTVLSVKNPNDAKHHFNLARVHAMAYSSKSDKAQIRKGKEEEGVWFGHAAPHLPFQLIKTKDHKQQSIANFHLGQALAEYVKALEIDRTLLPARLGYAWCAEQAGQKEIAIKEYRNVIEAGWKIEKDKKGEPFERWIVLEAAAYLKPLLAAEKDQAEIAELNEKIKHLEPKGRAVTPIAIPLQAGLTASELEDRTARVRFDADGSGLLQEWSWIKPNAAWLVYDQRGTGKPDSALQLFGNVTFWCFWDNGYEAMRSLDNNHDGKLADKELQHLALWQDTNSNGVADAGEVKPLAEHGIVALSCEYKIDTVHQDRIPFSAAGATFKNGDTRATYDLLLHSR